MSTTVIIIAVVIVAVVVIYKNRQEVHIGEATLNPQATIDLYNTQPELRSMFQQLSKGDTDALQLLERLGILRLQYPHVDLNKFVQLDITGSKITLLYRAVGNDIMKLASATASSSEFQRLILHIEKFRHDGSLSETPLHTLLPPPPTPITISTRVPVGATTTLNSTPTGGTWSSDNLQVATVDQHTGVVKGIAAGKAKITYTVAGRNVATDVTVRSNPFANMQAVEEPAPIKDEANEPQTILSVPYEHLEIIPNEGNDPIAAFHKGNFAFSHQDFAVAIECYTHALALDPNYEEAYHNRGNAKYQLQDHDGSLLDFDKAIELNPYNDVAYSSRSRTKKALANYLGSISDCDKAIEINPNYAIAYDGRGVAKAMLGNYSNAILDFTKAIEINPNYAEAYFDRGVAKIRLGQKDNARIDFTKAGELGISAAYKAIVENC